MYCMPNFVHHSSIHAEEIPGSLQVGRYAVAQKKCGRFNLDLCITARIISKGYRRHPSFAEHAKLTREELAEDPKKSMSPDIGSCAFINSHPPSKALQSTCLLLIPPE